MFEEQVSKLRAARELVQQFKQAVDESYEEWRAQNEDKIARVAQAKMDLKEIEDYLRVDIVMYYQETGNKKPHPKLGVRVAWTPTYDVIEMTEYAKVDAKELLVLDTKKTNKYIKALAGPSRILGGRLGGLVTFEEKPTATIARNLE